MLCSIQYRWRSVPPSNCAGRDCRSFGGRCCGIQAKTSCVFHWFSLDFDWMIRLEQRLTSLTAMKSQNLDRSSSPLAHVSVDQMSNSTLLRWWYVCSGRVGMNKYLHGLLSSIQPEHRTPGHGSSYDILACIVFSSFNEIVEFDISKREAGQS